MKAIIKNFIFLLLTLTSLNALASSQYTARITSFNTSDHIGGSSLTYFILENTGTRTTPQNCSYTYWVVNTDNIEQARVQTSLLLMAFSQNRSINVIGTSTCNSGGEIADYIWVTN